MTGWCLNIYYVLYCIKKWKKTHNSHKLSFVFEYLFVREYFIYTFALPNIIKFRENTVLI